MIALNIGIPTDSVDTGLVKTNSNNSHTGELFEFELYSAILIDSLPSYPAFHEFGDSELDNIYDAPDDVSVSEVVDIISPEIANLTFLANSIINPVFTNINSENNFFSLNIERDDSLKIEIKNIAKDISGNNPVLSSPIEQKKEDVHIFNTKTDESVIKIPKIYSDSNEPNLPLNEIKVPSLKLAQNTFQQNPINETHEIVLSTDIIEIKTVNDRNIAPRANIPVERVLEDGLKLIGLKANSILQGSIPVERAVDDGLTLTGLKSDSILTGSIPVVRAVDDELTLSDNISRTFNLLATKAVNNSVHKIPELVIDEEILSLETERPKIILTKNQILTTKAVQNISDQAENQTLLGLLASRAVTITPKSGDYKLQDMVTNVEHVPDVLGLVNKKMQMNQFQKSQTLELNIPDTEHNIKIDNKPMIKVGHRQISNSDNIISRIDENSPKSDTNDSPTNMPFKNYVNESKGSHNILTDESDQGDNHIYHKPAQTVPNNEIEIPKIAGKTTEVVVNNVKVEKNETASYEFSRVQLRDVPRKIMQLASATPSGSTQSAKLVMHPKSLGTIIVQITIADGAVKINLKGDNKESLILLESSSALLKERFQNKGLFLDKIEYELNTTGNETYSSKENQNGREKANTNKTMRRYERTQEDETQTKEVHIKRLRYDSGKIIEKYI